MQQESVSVATAIRFSSGHRSTASTGLYIIALTFLMTSTGRIHTNEVAAIPHFLICRVTRASTCLARVRTHVIEVLPESLHPPMRFLSTVGGQRVRDLLATVMVADANVRSFTVRVFLRCADSGLLTTIVIKREKKKQNLNPLPQNQ